MSKENDYTDCPLTDLIGAKLNHSKYGAGVIEGFVGDDLLSVHFEKYGVKTFSLQRFFQNGHVEWSDEDEWKPLKYARKRKKPKRNRLKDLRAYLEEAENEQRGWFVFRQCSVDFSQLAEQESFAVQFRHAMEKKGLTSVECYTHANIDRKLFSKIMRIERYTPRKDTAIALILTLSPTQTEMDDLLETLGYCLSRSSRFDLVIRYCLAHLIFNVDEINGYLYGMGLPLLGSCCN